MVFFIYDWEIEDIWLVYYKFDYDYNKIYDLFYKVGVVLRKMRVVLFFNDLVKESLNLYRILDLDVWVKLVVRV